MHELLASTPGSVAIDLFTLPLGTRLVLNGVEYDAWKAAVAALSGHDLTRFMPIKLSIFAVSGTSIESGRIDVTDLTTGNFVVTDGKAFSASEFKELLLSNDKLRVSTDVPATIPDLTHHDNLPLAFEKRRYQAGESLGMLLDYKIDEPDVINPEDPAHPFHYDGSNWVAGLNEVELYLLVRDGYVMADGSLFPVTYLIDYLRDDRNNWDMLHPVEDPLRK
ncbi:MAG TPA: hypothetical protein VJ843_02860 [Candidatus Saccharimonadales bacterium]|nr:hypothetical protein [Candidatus Saccharimonadales bacterium]